MIEANPYFVESQQRMVIVTHGQGAYANTSEILKALTGKPSVDSADGDRRQQKS